MTVWHKKNLIGISVCRIASIKVWFVVTVSLIHAPVYPLPSMGFNQTLANPFSCWCAPPIIVSFKATFLLIRFNTTFIMSRRVTGEMR